jgi:hypothetical protein
MGEIANDMIDGSSCSWCGCYFEEEHGYPVVCKECFDDWVKEDGGNKKKLDKLGLQIATEKLI